MTTSARNFELVTVISPNRLDDLTTFVVMATSAGHVGPYPDFRPLLFDWYTDVNWENLLLFPWMDEQALLLSEAYAELELESFSGRGYRMQTTELTHYSQLFHNRKATGTRILIKGDPGTGKTTFTHKLAFDWATGKLDLFDAVFVVKLKFAETDQPIESLIKTQIGSIDDREEISETQIAQYLKSGRDRVLLILDGLDEIRLNNYPIIKNIVIGNTHRSCTLMITSRPFVIQEVHNKMTVVARNMGFSLKKAREFVSNILDEKERREFFYQLRDKGIKDLYRVPLIIQALALLFKEYDQLPDTFTLTYDQLVFFIQSSSKVVNDLTEAESAEATAAVAELAFRGLTREDKQLIFSRQEIKNANIYKLGILTAEHAGSGFRPTTILQFPHKTFQENAAANHVVSRLQDGDRGPWETILDQFRDLKDQSSEPMDVPPPKSEEPVPEEETEVLTDFLSDWESRIAVMGASMQAYVDAVKLSAEQKGAGSGGVVSAPSGDSSESNAPDVGGDGHDPVSEARQAARISIENARQFLKPIAETYKAVSDVPFGASHTDSWYFLTERMESHKTLLSFVVGKLPEAAARGALLEIADAAVRNAHDAQQGTALPSHTVDEFLRALARENTSQDHRAADLFKPSLLTWDWLDPDALHYMPVNECAAAASMLTVKSSQFHAVLPEFLQTATEQLRTSTRVLTCKLIDVALEDLPEPLVRRFGEALHGSPLAALDLIGVNPVLVQFVLERLPPSLHRLTLFRCGLPPGTRPMIPPFVHLVFLRLEESSVKVEHLFESPISSVFPKLKRLSLRCGRMDGDDSEALRNALRAGRAPRLEEVSVSRVDLSGQGELWTQILACRTVRIAHLEDTGLSLADGQALTRALRQGRLAHLEHLDLIHNPEMKPLEAELKLYCREHGIELKWYTYTRTGTLGVGGSWGQVLASLPSVVSSAIQPYLDSSASPQESFNKARDVLLNFVESTPLANVPTQTMRSSIDLIFTSVPPEQSVSMVRGILNAALETAKSSSSGTSARHRQVQKELDDLFDTGSPEELAHRIRLVLNSLVDFLESLQPQRKDVGVENEMTDTTPAGQDLVNTIQSLFRALSMSEPTESDTATTQPSGSSNNASFEEDFSPFLWMFSSFLNSGAKVSTPFDPSSTRGDTLNYQTSATSVQSNTTRSQGNATNTSAHASNDAGTQLRDLLNLDSTPSEQELVVSLQSLFGSFLNFASGSSEPECSSGTSTADVATVGPRTTEAGSRATEAAPMGPWATDLSRATEPAPVGSSAAQLAQAGSRNNAVQANTSTTRHAETEPATEEDTGRRVDRYCSIDLD